MRNSRQSPSCENSLTTGTFAQCLYSQRDRIQSSHPHTAANPIDNGNTTSKGDSSPSHTPPHAHAPTSKGDHASSNNSRRSGQSENASLRPAPRNTIIISNVAPTTKGAPVTGDTESKRATNNHSTPNPFSPQDITCSCLKPNLSLQVLTGVGRIRGPARQPVVPTSTLSA